MLYPSHIIEDRDVNLFCEYIYVHVYIGADACVSMYVVQPEPTPKVVTQEHSTLLFLREDHVPAMGTH